MTIGIKDREISAFLVRLSKSLELVNEQAEDSGLWFEAQTASEAYLQQALRKLHAMVEGDFEVNELLEPHD